MQWLKSSVVFIGDSIEWSHWLYLHFYRNVIFYSCLSVCPQERVHQGSTPRMLPLDVPPEYPPSECTPPPPTGNVSWMHPSDIPSRVDIPPPPPSVDAPPPPHQWMYPLPSSKTSYFINFTQLHQHPTGMHTCSIIFYSHSWVYDSMDLWRNILWHATENKSTGHKSH